MPVTESGRVPSVFRTIQMASNSAPRLVTGRQLLHAHATRVRLALRRAEVLNSLPMAPALPLRTNGDLGKSPIYGQQMSELNMTAH